jgi:hypothetical protein
MEDSAYNSNYQVTYTKRTVYKRNTERHLSHSAENLILLRKDPTYILNTIKNALL